MRDFSAWWPYLRENLVWFLREYARARAPQVLRERSLNSSLSRPPLSLHLQSYTVAPSSMTDDEWLRYELFGRQVRLFHWKHLLVAWLVNPAIEIIFVELGLRPSLFVYGRLGVHCPCKVLVPWLVANDPLCVLTDRGSKCIQGGPSQDCQRKKCCPRVLCFERICISPGLKCRFEALVSYPVQLTGALHAFVSMVACNHSCIKLQHLYSVLWFEIWIHRSWLW